jgi:hypothetical protein
MGLDDKLRELEEKNRQALEGAAPTASRASMKPAS